VPVNVLHFLPGRNEPDWLKTQAEVVLHRLADRRVSVHVATWGPPRAKSGIAFAPGVSIHDLGSGTLPFVLARAIRLVQELRPDLIHVWEPAGWLLARLAGMFRRQPPILASLVELPTGQITGRRWVAGWLCRHTRWIVPSPELIRSLNALGIARDLIEVIPPVAALSANTGKHAATLRDEVVPKGSIANGSPVILALATRNDWQGWKEALWAFGILQYLRTQSTLVLAGVGSWRQRLEDFARDTQVADRVLLLDSHAHLAEWLSRADVVWLVSRRAEGLYPLVESLAAGKAVIAYATEEASSLVEDGRHALLIPAGAKPLLARWTEKLIEDAAMRLRLGLAAASLARRHHAVDRVVPRLLAIYEEATLLRRRPAAA
jgi:glycosyltransferase involved in cell wall biosynthesis